LQRWQLIIVCLTVGGYYHTLSSSDYQLMDKSPFKKKKLMDKTKAR
jgi:hypothetical protein